MRGIGKPQPARRIRVSATTSQAFANRRKHEDIHDTLHEYVLFARIKPLIEATESILEAVDRVLPPNPHGEGNYLDTVPFLDEAVAQAREAIAKAKGESE